MINKKLIMICILLICSVASATPPKVRIRVAEYGSMFVFSMPEGGEWVADNKTGSILPNVKCSILGKLLTKAVKKYHLMVGSCDFGDNEKMLQLENKFKNLGYKTHRLELGVNTKGLPDTRRFFIGVGVFDSPEDAEKEQSRLSSKNISSWVYNENITLARGNFILTVGKKRFKKSFAEIDLKPKKTIKLEKVEYAKGYSWHGFEDRIFEGNISVKWSADDDINCILNTDLEEMLAGVVPSEISAKAPLAALQAQAIAARGEIISKLGARHFNEGFDFCSEQHCQVYKGLKPCTQDIKNKIKPTLGLILENEKGKVVDAVYGGNCGGHTASNDKIWTSNKDPQLQGVWDTVKPCKLDLTKERDVTMFIVSPPECYCSSKGIEGSKKFRWTKVLNSKEWKKVEKKLGIGRIKTIESNEREVSGRIIRLKIIGEKGEKVILKELPIRRLLGGLRSSCFIAYWNRDKNGFITSASFKGAGWGHGVGMCQTGAQSRAKMGATFKEILLHYFTGAILKKIY